MPKTAAQRQAALRKRKAAAGDREVRGIWLPPEQHSRLKEYVKKVKVFAS